MELREKIYPGVPMRWRGPVPMAPEGGVDGAVPKHDANHAKEAAAKDEAAKKTESDRIDAAAKAAVEAARKAEAESVAAEAARVEAAKKADAERAEAAKRMVGDPVELAKKLGDLERSWDERGKAIDAKAQALEAKLEAARQKSVVVALRRMGADPTRIDDADLLALAPRVDPDDPAGLAALVKWRDSKPGFFKKTPVGPQENLAVFQKKIAENTNLTPQQRERRERMMRRVGGGE